MIEKLRAALFRIFKKDSAAGKIIDRVVTEEIILYIIFGVLTTLVNYVTTIILKRFIFTEEKSGEFTLVNAIAWAVSVLFAFFTNKLFVFKSKSFKAKVFLREFLSFVAARALTGLMEIFLPELLMKAGLDGRLFGVKGMIAKLAVSVFVIIFNYVFSKLVSFGKKSGEGAGDGDKQEEKE